MEQEIEKCMTPDCNGKKQWKGLCRSCYGQAKYLMDKGEVESWYELEQMGLVQVEGKPFMTAFKKKKLEIEKAKLIQSQTSENTLIYHKH